MIDCEQSPTIASGSPRPFFACPTRTRIWFTTFIAIQLTLYTLLTLISSQFHFESEVTSRPLPAVLAILAAAFVAYLCSIACALELGDSAKSIALFFIVAIAARGIVLESEPIQEVDIYRYIWDGAVSSEGISPYRFRPQEVQQAIQGARNVSPAGQSGDLDRLASLAPSNSTLGEVLDRIHFGELPTVYPPVSQVVFQLSHALTPSHAGVRMRLRVMKSVIVMFDLGVMLLLFVLLKLLGMNPGWCVAYGWSPLVIKEFANSGHLDSIAVFLVMASLVCIALATRMRDRCCRPEQESLSRLESRALRPGEGKSDEPKALAYSQRKNSAPTATACDPPGGRVLQRLANQHFDSDPKSRGKAVWLYVLGSGILIGLGVGAKLYPIILLPLFACFVWRRLGRRRSIAWLAVSCIAIVASLAPMTIARSDAESQISATATSTQLQGLQTFLTRWEINDLLFMLIEENIRPEGIVEEQPPLFFSVVPNAWRVQITEAASILFAGDLERTPFLLTRVLTSLALLVIVLVCCRMIWQEPAAFYEATFLTIAWFWFLSPTQNPWYWIWALPLVPFARSRLWLLVSGLTLIYYSRFWFQYHDPTGEPWGIPYCGVDLFDFVVVWIEFAPFLLLLFWTSRSSRPRRFAS